jgi:hypothetical protein
MKEILEKIREEFLEYVAECKKRDTHEVVRDEVFGLCYISNLIGEYKAFQEYLEAYKKTRNVFYDYYGNKTYDKNKFLWHPSNIQSRLNWLDKQISKLNK